MKKATLLLVLVLASCGTRPIYYWGSYESSIYRLNHKNEDFNIAGEIDRLSKEVTFTIERDQRVPPGKFMFLGYLHSLNNETGLALKYFEREKKAFPESAKFIEGLMKRIRGKGQK